MPAALHSLIRAHKEEYDVMVPAIIAQSDLATSAGWQVKVRRGIADG
jgi:hypothetical protein